MSDDRLRIDKWLWHARFCKTRAQAAALCSAGLISLNDQIVVKPAQSVKIGDLVALPRGQARITVEVLGLGERRGPYTEASALYRERARQPTLDTLWEPLLPPG